MRKLAFLLFTLLTSLTYAETNFGYISHTTTNIGDDIQSIAAKRFLPKNALSVDREFISQFSYKAPVKTVINGWFMHQKGGFWESPKKAPEISWPPSSVVDPLFISVHFTGTFLPTVFSDQNIEYLKKYAPIGARDLFTLNHLQKRGIPSYFSGCLTLTLENNVKQRNNIIYLVDLDQPSIDYIKSHTKSPIRVISHGKGELRNLGPKGRLQYANELLDCYRKCKCVVTTRLHAAMPCLAFETPVLMIARSKRNGALDARFTGLSDLTNNCSKEELVNGEVDYDFDKPPKNPKTYLPIRENLIKTMKKWVKDNSNL